MKKFLLVIIYTMFCIFLLGGCSLLRHSTVNTQEIETSELNLLALEPLKLEPVKFTITQDINKTPLYSMTNQNYINLVQDMEKIQNHLDMQYQIIQSQKLYYEKNKININK